MANVKNFGLTGVAADVQHGKGGPRLINNATTFNFRNSLNTSDAPIIAAGITSSSGNVTLTTGNLALSSVTGTLNIGGDTVLSRQQAGVFQFNGSLAFVLPKGTLGQRPASAVSGMMRFNDDTDTLEYYTGTVWTTLASGGSTAGLQTEIDNIETSLGPAINDSGIYVPTGFTGTILTGSTSFTDAIQKVANATTSVSSLEDIINPTLAGNIIYADSNTSWEVGQPGATTGVQKYDAGLEALAVKGSTGILVQTGADTYSSVTLTPPAAGITITNANGVAGNPTFALANDLAALEGLAAAGYAVRTGTDTWTTRTINGTVDQIVVTNGTGVSSNTDISLALVTNTGAGTFLKITRDGYGRVTGTTPVTGADIDGLIGTSYVSTAGDTMTGDLIMSGATTQIILPNAPTQGTHAVNRDYVESKISGLAWKNPVVAASTGTNVNIVSAPSTLDGVTLVAGNRVLLKDQTLNSENVIYIFNSAGTPLTPAPDTDTPSELVNATVFVSDGTINGDTGWTQTGTLAGATLTWVQFSGSNTYVAGSGLSLTGNTFNVGSGAGIVAGADDVAVDLYSTSTGGLILTEDGITRSTTTSSRLSILTPTGGGLTQDASGLYIADGGLVNAKLLNSSISFNSDSGGNTPVALGGTLSIVGSSTQGITTATTTGTITIVASNASASQKGVASFTTGEFVVTAGNVALGTIPASSLPGSGGITFAGTTGSDAVALGETVSIVGADATITTAVATNTVTISLGTVPVAKGGTGLTSLVANQLLIGNGVGTVLQDADLAFNPATNVLTVGSATLTGTTAGDVSLTATAANTNINLLPNGAGSVVVGAGIPGIIRSNTAQPLTVRGITTLNLESVTGSTTMLLPAAGKVTISGPTATEYATGLAANDLVNKQYVDQQTSAGGTGAIKAVQSTVNLSTTGTTNIGVAIPSGSTVVSVKVVVTAIDTGTGTLSIGKTGAPAAYMIVTENDPQILGIYIAETFVIEAASVQIIATVAGIPTSGAATVLVTYQLA